MNQPNITKTCIVGGAMGLAGLVCIGSFALNVSRENKSLREDLAFAQTKVDYSKIEIQGYQRELIDHGNPEGWKLDGDNLGNTYYVRWNGDGIGNCWKEYLPIN